jgi:murein DD-endopeptidase MepM/ murein hydrolase activator NlpD
VKALGQSSVFGKRKEPHTVIIARGNDIRHFTVRPWIAAAAGSTLAAIAIGYLVATSYLVLRDDLIGAAAARQARMQQAYEDRISALRAQVDRITSRQLLDQQLMEDKVSELLERQSQLTARHGRLEPVAGRAGDLPEAAPVPSVKPDVRAGLDIADPFAKMMGASVASTEPDTFAYWSTREGLQLSDADEADKLFVAINQSLRTIENEQLVKLTSLAEGVYETAGAISDALEAAGLSVDSEYSSRDVGGPLVAIQNATMFEAKVKELDDALDHLEAMKKEAVSFPLANPAPGRKISSRFGTRNDPLLGGLAHHSGMDFRAPMGSSARATASGKVVKAGWNGGYGRMVEIDHGNGFTTRYAHLSKITVKEGQRISAGHEVGKVGSSGRSTGPHLHYEIRKDGDAVDPIRFIKAGARIVDYL